MNPEYPSPEDADAADASSGMERQLKQLQPRPAVFDAETILSAAREAEHPVTLPDRSMRRRNPRSARWLTVSTAFVAGTAAGVLLTCLMLLRGGARGATATNDEEKDPPINNAAAGKNEITDDVTHEVPPVVATLDSRWSRDEYLIAANLLEMRRPELGEPPLMAGNCVLHSTSVVPRAEHSVGSEPIPRTNSPSAATHASDEVSPTRSIDREQLLRELLGVGPSTRL